MKNCLRTFVVIQSPNILERLWYKNIASYLIKRYMHLLTQQVAFHFAYLLPWNIDFIFDGQTIPDAHYEFVFFDSCW